MNATCPKCDGTGNLRAFSHIVSGRCFQCAGTGTVSANASEAAASTVSTIPTRDLPGFGRCSVTRDGDDFRVEGVDGFAIVALRPARVEVLVASHGWERRTGALAAAIQARRA